MYSFVQVNGQLSDRFLARCGITAGASLRWISPHLIATVMLLTMEGRTNKTLFRSAALLLVASAALYGLNDYLFSGIEWTPLQIPVELVEGREHAGDFIAVWGVIYEIRLDTWRVVIKRALSTADPEQDIQFVEGAFIPVAFAAWDGSNSECGSRHTLTTWYWVLLAEIWWARGASRKARTA